MREREREERRNASLQESLKVSRGWLLQRIGEADRAAKAHAALQKQRKVMKEPGREKKAGDGRE